MIATWLAAAAVGLASAPAFAQAPIHADVESSVAVSPSGDAAAAPDGGGAGRLVRDVLDDYKNFFSIETSLWLETGGIAAIAVHGADESIAHHVSENSISLPGGNVYGSQLFQVPVAIAVWAVASAAGSARHAETGRDLLRAQISVFSFTYAIKFAADRTRPNGDPRSFPSGHASTSFATAMVLQDHYGWKIGVPAFAAAIYTGISRVEANQHWASDVVFGAALGVACARTVTIKFRETRVAVSPATVPGGGAVLVTVVR